MDKGLQKYCPNCNKNKHISEAAYCDLCGTKLKNEPNREFYLRLNIPKSKIDIDQSQKTIFSGCPFFLRKTDEKSVQVVFFDEYPKCKHLTKDKHEPFGPDSTYITMTDKLLKELLNQGFKWLHESELATWY